jgi:hypothetical protein
MVGALMLVADLMFDGAVVFVVAAFAAFGCVALWCVAPLWRRRAITREA